MLKLSEFCSSDESFNINGRIRVGSVFQVRYGKPYPSIVVFFKLKALASQTREPFEWL